MCKNQMRKAVKKKQKKNFHIQRKKLKMINVGFACKMTKATDYQNTCI